MRRRRALLLLAAACCCARAPDGFRSISMFVGKHGEDIADKGEHRPGTKGLPCGRTGACDVPGRWHSQAKQDKVIFEAVLPNKRNGYFVDLAANHPIAKSNTRTLERDYGWNGICIDGNDEFLMLLLKKRRCQVVGAIVSSETDEEVKYRHWHGGGGKASSGTWQHALSGIVGYDNAENVKNDSLAKRYASSKAGLAGFVDVAGVTTRLDDILRKHNAPALIDYLSLDVEGAEFQVMRNFPFQSYTFYCVTIERPSAELKSLMISKGYAFASDMPGNFGEVLYVHQTIPGGAPAAIERVNKMLAPILAEQAAKMQAAKKKGR